MSQPGTEGVPGAAGFPSPEALSPFDLRLQQFSQHAGQALTPGEVQFAKWFYEAGGVDMVGNIAAASGAASAAAAEARPVTAEEAAEDAAATVLGVAPGTVAAPAEAKPAEEAAPVVVPAAEAESKPESLRRLIHRHPTTAEIRIETPQKGMLGKHKPPKVSTHGFANEGGAAIFEATNAVPAGASQMLLEHQAARFSANPREVVVFTDAGNTYANQMPEDTRDDEPGVVVDYYIAREESPVTVNIRRVLPFSAARRMDAQLERGEMLMTRELAQAAIGVELRDPAYADYDNLEGADLAEYNALMDAHTAIEMMQDRASAQKKPAVARLSNVPGLAGGYKKKGDVEQYSRVETVVK
ncbi:MAG TPA: hypothetical protein VLF62_00830 [Candidatus Saccharimonadales bacterium]|nr:hypothetical protein [Candidatus Saccharimonadales bacterium]